VRAAPGDGGGYSITIPRNYRAARERGADEIAASTGGFLRPAVGLEEVLRAASGSEVEQVRDLEGRGNVRAVVQLAGDRAVAEHEGAARLEEAAAAPGAAVGPERERGEEGWTRDGGEGAERGALFAGEVDEEATVGGEAAAIFVDTAEEPLPFMSRPPGRATRGT
jgi:hypothetical protein